MTSSSPGHAILEKAMKRLPSVDIVRGLVMVIMALDHVRDFLHVHADQSPTDLATTTPFLFFTRWITHLCAPTFVFLAGTSAWLYLHGGGQRRFLLQRGLVLIAIEFTLVNFAMSFDIHFRLFLFEVIATIGAGMFLLSFISRLSPKIILAIGILLIFGHDIIDFIPMPAGKLVSFIGSLLLGPGAFPLGGGRLLVIAYPILPWLGIMLAGYSTGRIFHRPAPERIAFLVKLGLAALALFTILRFGQWYGDPVRWSIQKNGIYTFLSFMNVSKYPPSLLFTLVTLGILMLVLAMVEKAPGKHAGKALGKPVGKALEDAAVGTAEHTAMKTPAWARFLLVYGRTPLFYFVVHLYLIHILLLAIVILQGHPLAQLDFSPFKFGHPAGAGIGLGVVYLVWVGVVLALYPLCRRYGRYKAAHKEKKWLRYL